MICKKIKIWIYSVIIEIYKMSWPKLKSVIVSFAVIISVIILTSLIFLIIDNTAYKAIKIILTKI